MEKRVTEIYFAVLMLGMLYAIFAAFAFHSNMDTGTEDKSVVVWNDQMEMAQEDGVYYYKRILPLENTEEKVIVYNTVHMYLDVFIDRNRVYALTREQDSMVKRQVFAGM